MQVYLIRHAQSYNNALSDPAGRMADPPLSDLGQRQADLLGRHLAFGAAKCVDPPGDASSGYGLDRLLCSAHLRCLMTAERIAEHTGLTPEIWLDLHEEMGIWQEGVEELPGLTPAEIRARFPRIRIPADMPENGWWNRPPELPSEWEARAARVVRRIRDEMAATDGRVAMVSHGGFIRDLWAELIHGGPIQGVTFNTRNTSIGRVDLNPDGIRIRYLNRIEHLPPGVVT